MTVNDNYSQYFSRRLTRLAQGFQGLKLTKTFSRDYQSSKKKSMRISHLLLSFNFKMVCLTLNFSILLKTILEFYDLIQEPFIHIKYLFLSIFDQEKRKRKYFILFNEEKLRISGSAQ